MVSKQLYRDGMSRFAAAVNIVTTDGPGGACGFTASAACSVTDDPPTLLVCLNRASQMHTIFEKNGVFCLNTLSADQQWLSAVQNDADVGQAVVPGMLCYPLGCLSHRLRGDNRRAASPALIGMFIDVAMIACQITAAMHLQDELPERQSAPGCSHDPR